MDRPTLDDLGLAKETVTGQPRAHNPNRVMGSQCATCPWRTDGQGLEIPDHLQRALESDPNGGNQYCHSPAWEGKPEDVICRGHRDHWANYFYEQGLLSEPTDKAWAEMLARCDRYG